MTEQTFRYRHLFNCFQLSPWLLWDNFAFLSLPLPFAKRREEQKRASEETPNKWFVCSIAGNQVGFFSVYNWCCEKAHAVRHNGESDVERAWNWCVISWRRPEAGCRRQASKFGFFYDVQMNADCMRIHVSELAINSANIWVFFCGTKSCSGGVRWASRALSFQCNFGQSWWVFFFHSPYVVRNGKTRVSAYSLQEFQVWRVLFVWVLFRAQQKEQNRPSNNFRFIFSQNKTLFFWRKLFERTVRTNRHNLACHV